MKKGFLIGFASAAMLLAILALTNQGASFNNYVPKLLKFEGKGYGIHQPIWGNRDFSKKEALNIHRHHYWNKYHGNLFDSQVIAEVLIDHLINAGPGKSGQNIKAFEKIISAAPDGVLSKDDVMLANTWAETEWIVNQYVDYRVAYYKSLRNKKYENGWLKRANSFRIQNEDYTTDTYVSNDYRNINSRTIEPQIEEYVVPAKKQANANLSNDVIEDL
jgi:lysozyme family protein